MSGSAGGCGTLEGTTGKRQKECTCLTCDVPGFCRNHYYRGKLLTERDFSDEQRYGIDKMRLHLRALHGWGVVCGLVVEPHPNCPDLRLVVSAGLAIDDCGRDIRVLERASVALPQPTRNAGREGPRGEGAPQPREGEEPGHDDEREERGYAERHDDRDRDDGRGHHDDDDRGDADDDEDLPLPDNPCDDDPAPNDLYLCIRYAECETEFAPAPFDDCACTTSSQRPNRICETYRFELYDRKPKFWDRALHERCPSDDCGEYYRMARHCHHEHGVDCIPLAIIRNVVPGSVVQHDQIDNWSARRQLATTETLDQIIRCILTKLPTEELTRIEDTNWEHGRRMLCREFMEEYIGAPERPRGFRIDFSQPVHSGAIDTRTFQALVVFRPDNLSDPRHMEVAPAYVEKEPDKTEWCRLRIEPGYARRHLDGRNFDLFITLKCDHVTDLHHRAVDGNYLGRRLPTGDNIQGGTFESWIRVRPRPRAY